VKISGASEAERPPWWPGRTEVSAQKQELADWEWLFAHTPPFRRRYRGPDGTVVLSVKKGIISEVLPEAFGDGSHPAKTEWQTFAGVALKRVDVEGIVTEPGTDWLKTAILKDLW
jgi:hypothetical protein